MPTMELDEVIPAWEASLRARNRSTKTIRSYGDTARLLACFLKERQLPTDVSGICREHVEMFIADQLLRWTPDDRFDKHQALVAQRQMKRHSKSDKRGSRGKKR